jgi:hypothetical protein
MMARKKLDTAGLIDDAAERANDVEPASTSKRRQRAPLKPERRTRTETEQMNFRVSQGLGRDIKLWALSHDVTPADVLEQGFELMKAKYGP